MLFSLLWFLLACFHAGTTSASPRQPVGAICLNLTAGHFVFAALEQSAES